MNRIALIVGATGGVGSETARALLARGWTVRALHRDPEKAAQRLASLADVVWLKGDAMNQADVVRAAAGASLVVHAANPPGYQNWQGLQLPMLESSIAAAQAAGARLVFPGTVYNYGADAFPVLSESSPQHPSTRKGAIRVAMEERLARAARDGVRVLVLRAGDFFGAAATTNSWFVRLVTPGKPVRSVTYPGKPAVGHAWAYLPDVGETIARLVEREADLAAFESFHFGGHWFDQGVEIADATRRAADVPQAKIRRFPWFVVYLLAPFVAVLREVLEMRYLWTTPVKLDNRKLVAFLGEEPHTELDTALRRTLQGLGCQAT
jgi:nucleoside-diphosphate-sugar epimerase